MMKHVRIADQDFRLWTMLRQTTDVMFRARAKELSAFGTKPRQAAVLFAIEATGAQTRSDIARWLFREFHSIATLVDRMETEGLVKKVKGSKKNEGVRVVATEKGRQIYNLATKREAIHRIVSTLSEEEREQLFSCLQKLRDKSLLELGMQILPPWP